MLVLFELFVLALLVKHDPFDRCVCLSQLLLKLFYVVEGFCLLKLAFDDVLFEALFRLLKTLHVRFGEVLNAISHYVVFEGFISGGERLPHDFNVVQNSAVDRNHPVVWEVFVTNFSHLRLLGI